MSKDSLPLRVARVMLRVARIPLDFHEQRPPPPSVVWIGVAPDARWADPFLFITAENSKVARAKGVEEKEKECMYYRVQEPKAIG